MKVYDFNCSEVEITFSGLFLWTDEWSNFLIKAGGRDYIHYHPVDDDTNTHLELGDLE